MRPLEAKIMSTLSRSVRTKHTIGIENAERIDRWPRERGGRLTSISITSDGFVIAGSTASDGGGAFIGGASDLDRNLSDLLNVLKLTKAETAAFRRVYVARVRDWRGTVVV
jgi:hypothetical protein